MRNLIGVGCAALLSACAANPGLAGNDPAVPVHGVTPGHKCDPAASDRFIGQAGTSETGAAILRATGAWSLRWAPPGTALTMDYREDRVTVELDSSLRITRIKCG